MNQHRILRRRLLLLVSMFLVSAGMVFAAEEPAFSQEQIKQFLLTAPVIANRQTTKGVTHPWRLTLSDGKVTHDASFQAIDKHEFSAHPVDGTREQFFVDSYKYNLAAYGIAELLGLDGMLPVYVERKWEGKVGSLSWWVPVLMDDAERHKRGIEPPNPEEWNRQMYRIRVLDQLIYDTDPNLTNILISPDWKLWRIDFTRAFRQSHELQSADDLVRCDRQLFEKLKTLDAAALAARTQKYLTKGEREAVLARRDKILKRFQQLIAQKGEQEVLY